LSPLNGLAVRLGNPTEVAYFNPGDVEHGVPCARPSTSRRASPGGAGTIGAQLVRPAAGYVDITPYYCPLGSAKGADAPLPPG
jgi:hypothetical protein